MTNDTSWESSNSLLLESAKNANCPPPSPAGIGLKFYPMHYKNGKIFFKILFHNPITEWGGGCFPAPPLCGVFLNNLKTVDIRTSFSTS